MSEIIERMNPAGFKEVSCTEGHWITGWKEGDSILDFSAFRTAYMPPSRDISGFRCITDGEYQDLMEKCRLRHEEEEAERRNKIEMKEERK